MLALHLCYTILPYAPNEAYIIAVKFMAIVFLSHPMCTRQHVSQEPTVTEQLDQSLNRVSFTPSGQYVAVGDEVGKITVFELGEELHTPHPDEWTRLQQLLMDISEQSQVDNVATKQEPAT